VSTNPRKAVPDEMDAVSPKNARDGGPPASGPDLTTTVRPLYH